MFNLDYLAMSQKDELIRPVMTLNDAMLFLKKWFEDLKGLNNEVKSQIRTCNEANKQEQDEQLFSIREVNSFEDRNFVFQIPSDIIVPDTSARTFILRVANLLESRLPAQLGAIFS